MDALALTRSLLLQAPPGELNDCIVDCRSITGDEILDQGILSALEEYNLQQLIVTEVLGHPFQTIICNAAQFRDVPGRYVEPRSSQSFKFDHLHAVASEFSSLLIDDNLEPLRKALELAAIEYVEEHFPQGVAAVFAPLPPQDKRPRTPPVESSAGDDQVASKPPASTTGHAESTALDGEAPMSQDEEETGEATAEFSPAGAPETFEPEKEGEEGAAGQLLAEPGSLDTLQQGTAALQLQASELSAGEPTAPLPKRFQIALVGNKYNPGNFWTGRWRGSYEVDTETATLSGVIQVNVHYYEQGNIQLSTTRHLSVPLTTESAVESRNLATAVMKRISAFEKEVQVAINEAHVEMNERTLKELRRTLPVTKSKLDWNRISSFRTARQLQRADT